MVLTTHKKSWPSVLAWRIISYDLANFSETRTLLEKMGGPNIRLKVPANANKGNRLHIGFNEDARLDYLQGFSKRKQERRRYGLAMGKLKKEKQLRADRTERREIAKESRPEIDEDDIIKVKIIHNYFYTSPSLRLFK
jgi:hypothetical protein